MDIVNSSFVLKSFWLADLLTLESFVSGGYFWFIVCDVRTDGGKLSRTLLALTPGRVLGG